MWICTGCGTRNDNGADVCDCCGKKRTSVSNSSVLPIIISISLAAITALILCFIFVDKREPILADDPEPVVITSPAVVSSPEVPIPTPSPIPTPNGAPLPAWGDWSAWGTEPIMQSESVQVETRKTVLGYNMVHYGTQKEESPHYRMFRGFSILNEFEKYGARSSYGEKHYTRYVTADKLNAAKVYHEGELVTGDYRGYQRDRADAYFFGDDKYVWYIESIDEVTEYRCRRIEG